MRSSRSVVDLPETTFFLFAVLLNFPWEFMQVPLFEGMAEAPHWAAIRVCARATLGDGVIVLISYWVTSAGCRDRWWFQRPAAMQVAAFAAVGLAITVLLEHLATRSNHPAWGWRYSDEMPLVPVVAIGLTPFLQWILLPPIIAWFARRQLR